MRLAMLLFAALCIGLGIWYEPLYALLPFPVDYVPYTGAHVVGQLQLLLFSGLAFFVMLPLLQRTLTITLDTDWLYRRLGRCWCGGSNAAGGADGAIRGPGHRRDEAALRGSGVLGDRAGQARGRDTGGMVLWVAIALTVYLLFYYARRS